jgi:transmembrane sensor
MSDRLTSREVYDEAAQWAAKLDASPLSLEAQAMLEAWLAADVRHYGALAQCSALLVTVSEPLPIRLAKPQELTRRVMLGGSLVAGLAAVVGAAGYVKRIGSRERYKTAIGAMRVVTLSDGSVVFLNTNSEISVRYSSNARFIELLQGEALFDVAKNKKRPFIVQSGTTLVRAVGTIFNVKALRDQPVEVLVREGVVEVRREDVSVAPVVLAAKNNKITAPRDAPIFTNQVQTVEVGRQLAWRVGRIAFHGETLAEAAEEFSRYSDVRIQIDDPEIAKQKITGLFVSQDPVGFANAVAVSFDLRAEIGDKKVLLMRP